MLSSHSALYASAQKPQTVGLVHILLKHQRLIVRMSQNMQQPQADVHEAEEDEQNGHEGSHDPEVVPLQSQTNHMPAALRLQLNVEFYSALVKIWMTCRMVDGVRQLVERNGHKADCIVAPTPGFQLNSVGQHVSLWLAI